MPSKRINITKNTNIDLPKKCTECFKTYLHQKYLNYHIRAVHDLVKYICTRYLKYYIRAVHDLVKYICTRCLKYYTR